MPNKRIINAIDAMKSNKMENVFGVICGLLKPVQTMERKILSYVIFAENEL